MTAGGAAMLVPLLAAGFAAGTVYFAALRRGVAALAAGGAAAAIGLTLLRAAVAAVLLGGAVRLGAAALLAAFAGFLAARRLALRAARRA